MKLVDVWLIFAQVVPWIEVLLHTLIDWMRTEEEEGREVNHHGKAITVGGSKENADKEMVNIVNRKTLLLKLHNPHGAPFVAVCWNRSTRKLLRFFPWTSTSVMPITQDHFHSINAIQDPAS